MHFLESYGTDHDTLSPRYPRSNGLALMQVATKHGIIFNLDKSMIKGPEVKFFGCIYDANGTRPDPDKVAEIHTLPAPENLNELLQFLGLVQHVSSFVPHLSNHKPLVNIPDKTLSQVPRRLQCMKLKLQTYDFEIIYKPRKAMIFPNMLSRAKPSPGPHIKLYKIIPMVVFSSEKLQTMQEMTSTNEITHQLRQIILDGWPDQAADLPRHLQQLSSCQDIMSMEDGLVMKGDQIIIPEALGRDTLKKLYAGHQGVVKCQLRAKTLVFWPDFNRDIELTVESCPQCQGHQPSQQRELLLQGEILTRPWHTISTDPPNNITLGV